MGLGGGEADPNPEMSVWLSAGSTHLWNLRETRPATDWAQIDQLVQEQMIELNYNRRKRLYDQAQETIAANLPYVFLATPNSLLGARNNLANFKPAILEPTPLWNLEQLYFRQDAGATGAGR
jgi:ABC-type transport system substrate-binding protein